MQKINPVLSFLLASLYMALTVGVGLKVHYCHGDISSIALSASALDCECGDESAEMSCCSTQQTLLQLDQECLVKEESELISFKEFTSADLSTFINLDYCSESLHQWSQEAPIVSYRPVYLLNSSFLFYG